MKRLLKLSILAAVALVLVACDNGSGKKGNINSNRVMRGPAAPYYTGGGPYGNQYGVPQPNSQNMFNPNGSYTGQNRLWGAIYAGSLMSNDEFDYNVHDFVANIMNPNELGTVSGSLNDSTGIRFWGYVEPNGGRLNPYGMNNVGINASAAELRIVIWDSYAGQVDANGTLITEVPVHIRGGASGNISGNHATIQFRDNYGTITLDGNFDAQYFQGVVYFDNTNGYANRLGQFFVSTCSFFRCN